MAKELKKITREELEKVLEAHNIWVRSDGNGAPGKRADLSYTDLSYKNLEGANLSNADLSGANLEAVNLRDANLSKANLSKVNLYRASLQTAFLLGINLSEANLSRVDFSGTSLSKANLSKADLSGTNLSGIKLSGADLYKTNLSKADLSEANLSGANLSEANLFEVNFRNVDLEEAVYLESELERAINVPSKYLTKKDVILNTESQIQSLDQEIKKLEEKLQQSTNATKEEKEIVKQKIDTLKEKVILFERRKAQERRAQEETKQQIEGTVKYLKSPNDYIARQITIQYFLMGLYLALSIAAVCFFMNYIDDNYTNFKLNMDPETTFINWLFYASPLLISFSLIIVFINQINARLQNIVHHNERKRQVDSIEGSLLAINVLSINNEEARKTILNTMEKIIDHALQSSEKANEPLALDEKSIEDPLTTLSKIKGLVK